MLQTAPGEATDVGPCRNELERELGRLTSSWGTPEDVSLYLQRCQVATPSSLVKATWKHVHESRKRVGSVLDLGAGDGRFAHGGKYQRYTGYEIDARVCATATLPAGATLENRCAFSGDANDYDVCIGNPPFVRNQDLPGGWREHAAEVILKRTGVSISGLANAWQYFFFLALASTKPDGLCALVVPYEWVSRPSSTALRSYIETNGWSVKVYRLLDATFDSVLTTSSITVVDKADSSGEWSYFEESAGSYSPLPSQTKRPEGVLPYSRRDAVAVGRPRVKRGLSPGTQRVLTLTEGERVRHGLLPKRDVVPCVTSLKHLPADLDVLSEEEWSTVYRDRNIKCWLLRVDSEPSEALGGYLAAVPEDQYQTATCLGRDIWWKFDMPSVPDALVSMSFKGPSPKLVRNGVRARAVGGVSGIYDADEEQLSSIVEGLSALDLRPGVVAYAHGLYKVEIGQLNGLLLELLGDD